MIILKEILWFKDGEGVGESISQDVQDITIRQKIDDGTNTINITLRNPTNYYKNSRQLGKYVDKEQGTLEFNKDDNTDYFEIYLAYVSNSRSLDTSNTGEDILMVAELKELDIPMSERDSKITLKCVDHTFSILGRIWTQSYPIEVHTGTITGITETILTDSTATFNTEHSGEKGKIIVMTSGTAEDKRFLITSNTGTTLTCINDEMVTAGVEVGDTYRVSWTSASIAQDVVRHATDIPSSQQGFDIDGNRSEIGTFAVDARFNFEGGYIEADREQAGATGDATNFPSANIAKVFKPIYEFLEEISQTEFTNTTEELNDEELISKRPYRYYIDGNNRFHWFYPRKSAKTTLDGGITSTDTTITVTDTTDFPTQGRIQIEAEQIDYNGKTSTELTDCTRGVNNTTAVSHTSGTEVFSQYNIILGDTSTGFKVVGGKMGKKVFDVVNHVIYRCGKDMEGSAIIGDWFDENSKLLTLKTTEKPYEDISRDILEEETRIASDAGLTGPTNDGNGWYDYPTNYDDYDEDDPLPNWAPGENISNDSEFNDSLKTEALSRGLARAQRLTQQRGSARWTGSIELQGVKMSSGEAIQFTSTQHGIYRKKMRVTQVNHKITLNSWVTTLDVEEDDPERGA